MIYDVAIIGAGPAGSTLTRLIPNKKVALIDARPLNLQYKNGDKLKSCGGLLAPDAQKILKKMNITLPNDIVDKIQPDKGVKTTDFNTGLIRYYKRNYINLDREKFDRFLLKDISADVFYSAIVRKIEREDNHYVINDKIRAKVIVGADGAGSFVRRRFFKNFSSRIYVSIQEIYNNKDNLYGNEFECFFDNNVSDYYGWALSKGDKRQIGYAIAQGRNSRNKFENFKQNLGYKNPISVEGTLIIRPKFWHPITCSENIFLIGEAGGYISPSSAEGISYAMKTAKILAKSNFNEKKFRKKMLKIQIDIFYKNIKSLLMYTPLLRHIIMLLTPKH